MRCVLFAAATLLAAVPAQAGAPPVGSAALQGVVRDGQGAVQIGALVEVLAANSATTVATAFTDLHGHYRIANLLPGRYAVRATATLFLPASKNNLQLRTGGRTIVNLTLATVFETASWLPSDRHKPGEAADDWKWTLRSTANRPILRILDDGATMELSAGPEAPGRQQAVQARADVQHAGGVFGGSGTITTFAANRQGRDGSDIMVQARMTAAPDPMDRGLSSDFEAGYQHQVGFSTARTIVRYRSDPEMLAVDGQGVQSVEIRSGERMELGDMAEIEAGGSVQAVHLGGNALLAAPFVRITAHPTGAWMVQYRLASSRDLQGADDLDGNEEQIPVAYVANGRLRLEQGRHQQLTVARKIGRGSIEVSVYHDALANVAVAGALTGLLPTADASPLGSAIVVDGANGSFRALANGYSGNGTTVAWNETLIPGLVGIVQYTLGDALQFGPASLASTDSLDNALSSLQPRSSQAGTVALQGHIRATRLRAAYRWQPVRSVSEVNPYGDQNGDGYLSFTVRQPLRWRNHLPPGLDAMIDVTNLLAQGYRPFVSADGQTLYFAQAPRTLRAGLAFTF